MRLRALLVAAIAVGIAGCRDRVAVERAQILALEREREALRARLDALAAEDPRLAGMPAAPVRVGVPTSLVRAFVEALVSGFVDQLTLELRNVHVEAHGTVRKVVDLGRYDLDVTIEEMSGRLRTSRPELRFGGNQVSAAMEVKVASGDGRARIRFRWRGSPVAGAVCGNLEAEQVVTGSVKPRSYPVRGMLQLQATPEQILATPRVPLVKLRLGIDPSAASWAAVQKLLDAHRSGVCGFVLDRIDLLKLVKGMTDKGFYVHLPTEKLRPIAVPVRIEPRLDVGGRPLVLAISLGALAITEQAIWLGVNVSVRPAGGAGPPPPVSPAAAPPRVRTTRPVP